MNDDALPGDYPEHKESGCVPRPSREISFVIAFQSGVKSRFMHEQDIWQRISAEIFLPRK